MKRLSPTLTSTGSVLRTLSLLMLSGCSTYSEHFDCPIGEGMKCTSLSTVNKRIDAHEVDLGEEQEKQNLENVRERKIYYTPKFRENLEKGI